MVLDTPKITSSICSIFWYCNIGCTEDHPLNLFQVRMEAMIMKVQKDFVNALQREEDPRYKFKVDRWTRTEGGGGVTCILQVSLL